MKDKVKTRLYEQETVITIDPSEKRAYVYSCIPVTMRKLESLSEHEDVIIKLDDTVGFMISCPAKWIKIKPPRKSNMTEEQKAAKAEALKKVREEKMS